MHRSLAQALRAGFTVGRVYEPVDNPKDVRQDAQGTWHIRAGARVRAVVTIDAPTPRYHVAVVDPLLAGLESAAQPTHDWSLWEHQNLRDDRAEAFTTILVGHVEYRRILRANTRGNFVAPPARAEEMYEPETFGRSATDTVIVQ